MRHNYVFILVLMLCSKLVFGQALPSQINFKGLGGNNDIITEESMDFLEALVNYEELTPFLLQGAECDLEVITQPEPATLCTGEEFSLSVVAGGTPPFFYQWKKGSVSIPGATGDTYNVFSASTSDAGDYKCWVGSSCGRIYSSVVTIVVNTSIVIDSAPEAAVKCAGEDVTFSVVAHGAGTLTYKWYKNNNAINGATNENLTLTSVSENDDADYYCAISNSCGNLNTQTVHLTISNIPKIVQQLLGAEKCIGLSHTFEVTATDGNFYQWFFNDNPIEGANSLTYNIEEISSNNDGDYYLVITNTCGSVTTNVASLNVITPPSITDQSESFKICEGSEVIFEINASGTEPLTYQWFKGGTLIEAENNPSYSIESVVTDDAGDYSSVVTNVCNSVSSNVIPLAVDLLPNITSQSDNGNVCLGSQFKFSVSVTGTEPIAFQWFKNENQIEQTSAEFTIGEVALSDAADYNCRITNLCGEDFSQSVALVVDTMPKITLQAISTEKCTGESVQFNIEANGTEPLSFQWYFNGELIEGANNEFISTDFAIVRDAGDYFCVVSNACGTVTSETAVLTIDTPPVITEQTTEGSICSGESTVISVNAEGTELTYQWFNNNGIIENAVSSSIEVNTTADYYCVVSGKCQPEATSETIPVIVGIPPRILEQPISIVQCSGNSVEFSLVSEGTSLVYQWFFNGFPIPESNQRTLFISNISFPENAGEYSCIVSNDCGHESSQTAVLTIDNSFIITTSPVSLEKCIGGKAEFSVLVEGSGMKFQWYKDKEIIEGSTQSVLTIDPITDNDQATYAVEVFNTCNSEFSDPAHLTVLKTPQIIENPSDIRVCNGAQATFNVTASGYPLHYKWFLNDEEIPGAIESAFTIQSVLNPDDLGEYKVEVYNECGNVTSSVANLGIDEMLTITSSLLPVELCQGGKATFSIEVTGTNPHFQWIKDHAVIYNTTSNVFTIDPVTTADAGEYGVGVFNGCASVQGELMSNFVLLTVDSSPEITTQPIDAEVCNGNEANFTVVATGSPLNYKWFFNDVEIAESNADSYSLPSAGSDNTGEYKCMVYNDCDTVYSNAAVLKIDQPIIITTEPVDIEQCEGTSVAFFVVADGSPIKYQWFFTTNQPKSLMPPVGQPGGTKIGGATSSSLTLENISAGDAKRYYCTLTNACGTVYTHMASLKVDVAPEIETQPSDITVCAGSDAFFSVVATGSALSYKWSYNGFEIPDAVNDSYSIAPATIADAGEYSCMVYNLCDTVFTEIATLKINEPPVITLNTPVSANLCINTELILTVEATGSEITYQWLKNNVNIEGATDNSYTLTEQDFYQCKVSNMCSTQYSNITDVRLAVKPVVISSPVSIHQCEGTSVSGTVVASGTEPLSYQWYKDGILLSGYTADSYTIPSINIFYQGDYYCIVSNECGSVTTEAATLTVDLKPVIETQPLGGIGCRKNDFNFTVVASGFEPLNYYWFKDGFNITDEHNSSLILTNLENGNSGEFYVDVVNSCGFTSSDLVTLNVSNDTKPVITNQPDAYETCEGNPATFTVEASGSDTFDYTWYFNGTAIEGANGPVYTIESIDINNQGDYYCVLSNYCGTTTSDLAALTVDLSPVFTQQPLSVTGCLNGQFTVSVEVSGTTPFKYKWYKNTVGISGATNATYSINNLTLANVGDYNCVVTNDCNTVISDIAHLSVVEPITITQQSLDVDQCVGTSASFSVEVSGANPTFQWYNHDALIEGANSNTLTIPSISAEDASNGYICLISGCNSIFSQAATLNVGTAPAITLQPANALTCPEIEHTFNVTATGKDLTFQWYNENGLIEGAVNSSFATAEAGTYYSIVNGSCGEEVQSIEVTLALDTLPLVLAQPVAASTCPGIDHTFSVEALGSQLTFQWFNESGIIEGAVESTYKTDIAGNYYSVITGACGSPVNSDVATLTVNELPVITLQPIGAEQCIDTDFSMISDATGTAPLTFNWYRDGQLIEDASGSASYSFTIDNVNLAANYTVVVSNVCGSVTSDAAALIVDTAPALVIAPSVDTRILGDNIEYTLEPAGTAPFNYQWLKDDEEIEGATNSSFNLMSLSYDDAGDYSAYISNSCGDITAPVATLIVKDSAHYNLSGIFTYDNKSASPMKNVSLNLKTAEDVTAYTTVTDETGAYNFGKVLTGSYTIEALITKKWAGSNPTDALLILRNYIGTYNFADVLKTRAADVNSNLDITPNDALFVNERFVLLIDAFEPPIDWLYENEVIDLNADIVHDFKAICTGDVDGSNKMTGERIMFNNIPTEGSVKVKSGLMFDVPVSIAKDVNIGALGLKIKYPSSSIKIYDVVSDISGLVKNINDNEVNIGWASAQGKNFKQGEQIIVLKCMLTSDDVDVDNLFTLSNESEIADNNANQLDIQNIRMPKIMHKDVDPFTFSSYPNPFVGKTTLTYYLPSSSEVKVVVTDVLGKEVAVLVNDTQTKGLHNVNFDASNFTKGIYLYTITAGSQTGTGKLIKIK